MHWDVTVVRAKPKYKIYVETKDGRKGIFDMEPYLNHGVFKELKNINYLTKLVFYSVQ